MLLNIFSEALSKSLKRLMNVSVFWNSPHSNLSIAILVSDLTAAIAASFVASICFLMLSSVAFSISLLKVSSISNNFLFSSINSLVRSLTVLRA